MDSNYEINKEINKTRYNQKIIPKNRTIKKFKNNGGSVLQLQLRKNKNYTQNSKLLRFKNNKTKSI